MFRFTLGRSLAGASVFGGGAALVTSDDHPTETVYLAASIPTRAARDVLCAAACVLDYQTSLQGNLTAAERERAMRECHQRGAERLRDLCFANGGVYTKLGQHVGQLDHLLPEEYVQTMRKHLLDRCPLSDLDHVRTVIQEDLGADPEEIFADFSPQPIASASLAQVHTATLRSTGERVAVKVQHAGLREGAAADIATIDFLVRTLHSLFPDFDYGWLVEEIKDNLPNELDFRLEVQNAERCRQNLASSSSRVGARVAVPRYHHAHCGPRVVTMEFMEGVHVTDTEGLRRLGLRTSDVANLVSETFSEMIFVFGDVHADPHEKNLLVARGGDGRPRLVLLDHGLYRRITPEFRREYAGLWRSLILADVEGIKRHSRAMNAGDMYPLFASMITARPWDQVIERRDARGAERLKLPGTVEDKRMIQQYAQQYAAEISQLLLRIPRPLLLLLKTNDCLRAVDHALGQPVNTYAITARFCARALAEEAGERQGVRGRLALWSEQARMELAVAGLRALGWTQGVRAAVLGAPSSRQPTVREGQGDVDVQAQPQI